MTDFVADDAVSIRAKLAEFEAERTRIRNLSIDNAYSADLDFLASKSGFTRTKDESDWTFRQRIKNAQR